MPCVILTAVTSIENGPRGDGRARDLADNEDVKEFYLGVFPDAPDR
jgi:hypothetical protein